MKRFEKTARLRVAGLAVIAAVALGVLATSALAVVNGSPDNGRHPYVGMVLVFPTGNPANGFELCSGSLVSATVMVTAAHCFAALGPNSVVLVDMKDNALADAQSPGFGSALRGVAHPDPHWASLGNGLSQSDRNDIAVVTLPGAGFPQPDDRYAQLPSRVGVDDKLPNNQAIEIVGYGIQNDVAPGYGTRFVAPAKIVPGGGATGSEFLKVSSSAGQGGATCNGDSGGPVLQAGTDAMLALSSYGASATCKAVAYAQRMDTAEALGFVSSYLR
jgi:secreted trypsin-like serine protease